MCVSGIAPLTHFRYRLPIMTMSFDIPPDVQASVASIPGLDTRVALYLRHEAQLEAVRRLRLSPEGRSIAERALMQAERDRDAGFDWDASFEALRQKLQEITAGL